MTNTKRATDFQNTLIDQVVQEWAGVQSHTRMDFVICLADGSTTTVFIPLQAAIQLEELDLDIRTSAKILG